MTETTKYNAEGLLSYVFLRRGILFFFFELYDFYIITNWQKVIRIVQISPIYSLSKFTNYFATFALSFLSFSSIAHTQILTHTFSPPELLRISYRSYAHLPLNCKRESSKNKGIYFNKQSTLSNSGNLILVEY